MGVVRYRDVSEMPPPPRVTGPDLWRRIRALWSRSTAASPLTPPRGVQRFRTMHEAAQERESRTIERMRRTRAP